MFRCDTETYLKNHTISVGIKKQSTLFWFSSVVFNYDFGDISIFAGGEQWQKFIHNRQ